MNHDLTHCHGEGCMLRESCLRYHAHLDAQAHPDVAADHLLAYHDEQECIGRGYALLWKTYDLRDDNQQKGGKA